MFVWRVRSPTVSEKWVFEPVGLWVYLWEAKKREGERKKERKVGAW